MKRLFGMKKGAMAIILTAAMLCSTVQGTSITGYATEPNLEEDTAVVLSESIEDTALSADDEDADKTDGSAVEENADVYTGGGTYTVELQDMGDGTKYLDIYESEYLESLGDDASNADYDAALVEILNTYPNACDQIYINYNETAARAVPKAVWNAAVAAFKTEPGGDGVWLNILYNTDHTEESWSFQNPKTIEADTVSTAFTQNVVENGITISFGTPAAYKEAAASVYVGQTAQKTESETIYDKVKNIFGDNDCRLQVMDSNGVAVEKEDINIDGEYSCWEEKDEDDENTTNYYINYTINNIQELTADTEYTLEAAVYHGEANEWTEEVDGQQLVRGELYIDAKELTKDEVLNILKYYQEKLNAGDGKKFDHIVIEAAYSTNNYIDKDYINAELGLLKEEETAQQLLRFVFCRCRMDDDTPYKQDDIYWELYKPSEATLDINANVTLTLKDNQGATVKINKATNKTYTNTYPAEKVNLQFYASPDYNTGVNLLNSFGGDYNTKNSSNNYYVLTLKNNALTDAQISYQLERSEDENEKEQADSTEDRRVSLYLESVQNLAADTDYQLIRLETCYEDWGRIGADDTLTVPEGAANSKFTSYNTDVATVDSKGNITRLKEGDVYFTVSYKLNNSEYLKAYGGHVAFELEWLKFKQSSLTMELPYSDEADSEPSRTYLEVKWYPANASVDQDSTLLTWETSNANVVRLVSDEEAEGRVFAEGEEKTATYSGWIEAVGEGTATVTATYVITYEGDEAPTKYTTTCEVTVKKPFEIPQAAMSAVENLYAITNVDAKLSDIALPDGWSWQNDSTSLASYVGASGARFPATYTDAASKESADAAIWVNFYTITGVNIVSVQKNDGDDKADKPYVTGEVSTILTDKWEQIFDYQVVYQNGDGYDFSANEFDDGLLTSDYISKKGLTLEWSSNPTGILKDALEGYPASSRKFTADASASGKKTFTFTLKDKAGKVIAKNSIAVTVAKGQVMDFDTLEKNSDALQNINSKTYYVGEKGIFYFSCRDNVQILKVESSDTSVLSLGTVERGTAGYENSTDEYSIISVDYEMKQAGQVLLTITADDEVKSTKTYVITVVDKEPKIAENTFKINKAYSDQKAPLTIYYNTDANYAPADQAAAQNAVTVEGTDFTYEVTSYKDGAAQGYLKLNNAGFSGKKATIKLTIILNGEKFEKSLTVQLVNTAPRVTFKQTKKVNTFYTKESDNNKGVLTVNTGSGELTSLQVNDDAAFSVEKVDAATYKLALKNDYTNKTNKKITLTYTITDSEYGTYTGEKKLTVATESKKPVLAVSAKSDTLYPNKGYTDSVLTITDKTTGDQLENCTIYWKDKAITAEGISTGTVKKNSYTISLKENSAIQFKAETSAAGTDKLTINVKGADWTSAIKVVDYSIKVNLKNPTLKLSNANLTLNINEAIEDQSAVILLTASGCSTGYAAASVDFIGKDDKSKTILNQILTFEYTYGENGRIIARLSITEDDREYLKDIIKTGTYKYIVKTVDKDGYEALANLTVKLTDKAPEKCVTVKKKGSIDVLRRDTTSMVFTCSTAKDMVGTVIDGWLEGADSALFDSEFVNGQLIVTAREGESYSTKAAYNIAPVFEFETVYGTFSVTTKEQSFKVTQGKPKVTVTASKGNVLYAQAGNNLDLDVAAVLKNEDITISDVKLLNYTKDLGVEFNSGTGVLSISRTGIKDIKKTGKTWSLKFAVIYKDKAGNEKNTAVTYKVVVN